MIPLTPERLEFLLSIYFTKNGRVNANFSGQVNQLSQADREKVFAEVASRGLDDQRIIVCNQVRQNKKLNELSPTPNNDDENDDEGDDEGENESEEDRSNKRIVYTEAEWDALSSSVFEIRQRRPLLALTKLVAIALKKFPPGRQRKLIGRPSLQPILDRIIRQETENQVKLADYQEAVKMFGGKIPTRAELVASLTDEELATHKERITAQVYADLAIKMPTKLVNVVLHNISASEVVSYYTPEELLSSIDFSTIVGHTAKNLFNAWMDNNDARQPQPSVNSAVSHIPTKVVPHKPQSTPTSTPVIPKVHRKLRVTLLALNPNQQHILRKRFENRVQLNFVEKNRGDNAIPDNQDIILLWTRFSSHAMQDQAKAKAKNNCILIAHDAGMTTMIKKLEEAIAMKEKTSP